MATAASKRDIKDFVFEWEGKDRNGKIVRGETRAVGENQVQAMLRAGPSPYIPGIDLLANEGDTPALEHGQTVGRLVYERMSARPERLYGQDIASNYQGQGLKLAKQFAAG